MARVIKVPAHTRNGKKVKGYSYTVGGKTTHTVKEKTKQRTSRRKTPTLAQMKKKDPRVGVRLVTGIKWGSKAHLDDLKYSLDQKPKSKYAASWKKKIKEIIKLRGG